MKFQTNEDLYFWIMIGLACLSGLLLLLLIICLSYICCALSRWDSFQLLHLYEQTMGFCPSGNYDSLRIIAFPYCREDEARKTQQTEPVRPPPPVYLSTPPRDPRYGYRGPPLDPYGRPEAGYREEYVGVPVPPSSSRQTIPSQDADFDSIAAEWTEPSERREARV